MTSAPSTSLSLGRRLSRRALDLLVVAFLVTVGLSVGRQLIDWWRIDPSAVTPDLSSLNPVELDWSRTPVTLQFGDAATALQRIPFVGNRKQLDAELTRIGQSIVTTVEVTSSRMEDTEKDWLAVLREAPPVFWDSTRGNVYRRHEPLPSFVATRFVEPQRVVKPQTAIATTDDEPTTQRIVGWGLAFPTSPGDWTIYVFHPDSAASTSSPHETLLTAPEGSRNVTHIQGADGCQWRVIQGRGELSGWVQQFHQQFESSAVVAKIVGPRTASLKYRREQTVTDIQIRCEPDGRLTAVIWSANERGP